jgi:cytochrome c oxidase cbb3-type subunit 3
MSDKKIDEFTGIDTTGHEWDGIKELNNPLPRWWLWTLYLTIIWGLGYVIAYPAWPLIKGATPGLIGYSTRALVEEDINRVKAQNAEVSAALAGSDLSTIQPGTEVYNFGISGGAAVYRANCIQCHGAGAAGAKGYPNLLDDDWLWGGDLESIEATVRHGIRNTQDDDARYSEMPKFGELLEPEEIEATVQYVLSLSGRATGSTVQGKTLFEENCASCHGESAEGMRDQGAPALNDAIWLYGSGHDDITESVVNARFGVMPAWGARLSEADIKAVTLYIHQLGGGE